MTTASALAGNTTGSDFVFELEEEQEQTNGEFLIDVVDGASVGGTADRIEAAHDAVTVERSNDVLGYVAIEVADGQQQIGSVLEHLDRIDGVGYIERNERARLVEPPAVGPGLFRSWLGEDASFDRSAGSRATGARNEEWFVPEDPLLDEQYPVETLDLPRAWRTTTGSETVTVAILDSGIKYDHPTLDGQFRDDPGRDFLDDDDDPYATDTIRTCCPSRTVLEQHGTWVAGTLAAHIDDGYGTAGIADVELIAGRIFSGSSSAPTADIVDAIQWAADEGADIINMSFHLNPTKQLKEAVEYAQQRDVLLVAASGNDGEHETLINYPARYDGVLSVGATSETNDVMWFSQGGPNLSVVAPGYEVLSPSVTDGTHEGHQRWWGTSASAPIASGIAALALAVNPDLTAADLYDIVVDGAIDIDEPPKQQGAGLVNAANSVDLARGIFPDIRDHPFQSEIRILAAEDTISGYDDGWFRPERSLTRAEFATMLAVALDLDPDDRPQFSDVDGHWARENIRTVAGAGFFGGYPDGTFRPDNSVSTVEALVALSSGLGYSGGDPAVLADAYDDAEAIPDWARQAIANVHAQWGGIERYERRQQDGRVVYVDTAALDPTDEATRAEAAYYVFQASSRMHEIASGKDIFSTVDLSVRAGPSADKERSTVAIAGTRGTILDTDPVEDEQYTWWRVEWEDGTTGWSVGQFLYPSIDG
jgi:subtilisin family serine protease